MQPAAISLLFTSLSFTLSCYSFPSTISTWNWQFACSARTRTEVPNRRSRELQSTILPSEFVVWGKIRTYEWPVDYDLSDGGITFYLVGRFVRSSSVEFDRRVVTQAPSAFPSFELVDTGRHRRRPNRQVLPALDLTVFCVVLLYRRGAAASVLSFVFRDC